MGCSQWSDIECIKLRWLNSIHATDIIKIIVGCSAFLVKNSHENLVMLSKANFYIEKSSLIFAVKLGFAPHNCGIIKSDFVWIR